jgi:hypothetical protein
MKIKQSDIIADRLPEIKTVNGYTNVPVVVVKRLPSADIGYVKLVPNTGSTKI